MLAEAWITGAGCRCAVRRLATAGTVYLSGCGKVSPGDCREMLVSMELWESFFRAALTELLERQVSGMHERPNSTFAGTGLHCERTAGRAGAPACRPAGVPPPARLCREGTTAEIRPGQAAGAAGGGEAEVGGDHGQVHLGAALKQQLVEH